MFLWIPQNSTKDNAKRSKVTGHFFVHALHAFHWINRRYHAKKSRILFYQNSILHFESQLRILLMCDIQCKSIYERRGEQQTELGENSTHASHGLLKTSGIAASRNSNAINFTRATIKINLGNPSSLPISSSDAVCSMQCHAWKLVMAKTAKSALGLFLISRSSGQHVWLLIMRSWVGSPAHSQILNVD